MQLTAAVLLLFALPLAAQTTLLDQGRAALAANEPEKAVALLRKAADQTPNSAETRYWLGRASGRLAQQASLFRKPGLAKETLAEFERAVALDPNHVLARFALVEYYMQAPGFMGGDEEKAMREAAEIRKRDPLMGHRAWSSIYMHQKKLDLARQELADGVKEQPSSAKAHYYLGLFFLVNEKAFNAASAEFEAAVKLDPNFMPSWFQLGQTAVLSGANLPRGEEALRKYAAYTPKDNEPASARAHYWLGAAFEKQGKKADAKVSYGASLRLNPNQKDVAEALKRVQ